MDKITERVMKLCFERKESNEKSVYSEVCKQINKEFNINKSPEQIRWIYRKNKDKYKSFKEINDGKDEIKNILIENNYNPNVFDLVNIKKSKWTSMGKNGTPVEMESVKLSVKPKSDYDWSQENIDNIFKNINISPIVLPTKQIQNNGRCLIFPISDLHLGLLSEKGTSGNEYNIDIAKALFIEVLTDVLSEVRGQKFEKVLFIIGNDFVNADNINDTTTKGTPQDCCALWNTIVDTAIQLCITAINSLYNLGPVDVICATSNHDFHTMYGIMNTLKAYYRTSKNINIINDISQRKYYKFGNNIIGIAHDIKVDKALELMSVEAHDIWSECTSMIWLLGHLHQQMTYSKKGYVEIMRLPTVSGVSRWASQQGYTQTEKRNQAFILDSKKGIKTVINSIIK